MADIGVGAGAVPTRAEKLVLDLTSDPKKNLALIQAAFDEERAEATAPGPAPVAVDHADEPSPLASGSEIVSPAEARRAVAADKKAVAAKAKAKGTARKK